MMIETLASLALDRAGVNLLQPSPAVVKSAEETSNLTEPKGWLVNALGGRPSVSGKRVDSDNAMNLAAVWACVTVISESLASLPIHLYREVSEGEKRKDRNHPVYGLLTDRPNKWQTPFEWKEQMTASVLLGGNAMSYLKQNGSGVITDLIPMSPKRTTVYEDAEGDLHYRYTQENGRQLLLRSDQVFHLRGKSLGGKLGVSPLTAYRNAVGYAMALEEFGAALMRNGNQMGGFIKVPGNMDDGAKKNFQKFMEDRHRGFQNAFKLGVLDEGMEWVATSVTPQDAQFLEARRFQIQEICSVFRVPPHMAGELSRSTNNNITQQSIEFVTHCLGPWMFRWEQAIERDMLSPRERAGRVVKVNANALLRADIKTRFEAYGKGRQWGYLSANDIRALEEMDKIPGGDRYLEPVNMKPVSAAAA